MSVVVHQRDVEDGITENYELVDPQFGDGKTPPAEKVNTKKGFKELLEEGNTPNRVAVDASGKEQKDIELVRRRSTSNRDFTLSTGEQPTNRLRTMAENSPIQFLQWTHSDFEGELVATDIELSSQNWVAPIGNQIRNALGLRHDVPIEYYYSVRRQSRHPLASLFCCFKCIKPKPSLHAFDASKVNDATSLQNVELKLDKKTTAIFSCFCLNLHRNRQNFIQKSFSRRKKQVGKFRCRIR